MVSNHATKRTEPGSQGRRASSIAAVLAAALLATTFATGATTSGSDGEATASDLLDVMLAFEHEPAHAQVDERITNVPFDRDGQPVTVALDVDVDETVFAATVAEYEAELAASLRQLSPKPPEKKIQEAVEEAEVASHVEAALDTALEGRDYPISLTLERDPSGNGGGLTGNEEFAPEGNVGFDELTLGMAGRGYKLQAEVSDDLTIQLSDVEAVASPFGTATLDHLDPSDRTFTVAGTSDPSDWFSVFAEVAGCDAGSCGVGTNEHADFDANVEAGSEKGWLALSLTDEELSDEGRCGDIDYLGLPSAVLFDSVDVDVDKRATFVIDKERVQLDTDNGRAHYDICMVSETEFTPKDGAELPDQGDNTDDPLRFGPALLEDCHRLPTGDDGACIEERTGYQNGGVKLVVQLPAEDPWMR